MPRPLRRPAPIAASRFAFIAVATACGGVDDGTRRSQPVEELAASAAVELRVERQDRHQTIEGFGAAVAWWGGWLAFHVNRDEIVDLLFRDMGADIIRMRNTYGREEWETEIPAMAEITRAAEQALGHAPLIQMSSWSPPAGLKDNAHERCDNLCEFAMTDDELATCVDAGCTLAKDGDGEFRYDDFADYWHDSLVAFREAGVVPTWISIQNEPDFLPSGWEGCRFEPEETGSLAGYDRALAAVHDRLLDLDDAPLLIGPETLGVHRNRVLQYGRGMNMDHVYGVAHHLYEGEAYKRPDSYLDSLETIREEYEGLPIFQTEFSFHDDNPDEEDRAGMFETAWLIHNSMAEQGAAAYLYWELIWNYPWPDQENPRYLGLVSVENPGGERWQTPRGYEVQPDFHAMRHFSRFTDPGYVRVGLESSSDAIRASAYVSPNEDVMTVVVLNTGQEERDLSLDLDDFEASSLRAFRSAGDTYWEPIENVDVEELTIPGRGIITVVAEGD